DVLLDARERHVEFLGKLRDRSVGLPQSFENAASGGIRKRGKRGIQADLLILNHMVQYKSGKGRMQGGAAVEILSEPDDRVAVLLLQLEVQRLSRADRTHPAAAMQTPEVSSISGRSLRCRPSRGQAKGD